MPNENDMNMKLEFFFKDKTLLHITCNNGRFYNGSILDITPKKKLLVFKDNRLGTVPILFEEIVRVEPFTEDKKKGKENDM